MVTATERTELRNWVRDQGGEVEMVDRRAPKALWWRADGKPLGMLPADPFHMRAYMNKGFTLRAPDIAPTDFPEAPVLEFQQRVAVAEEGDCLDCDWKPRKKIKNRVLSLAVHRRHKHRES